MSPHPSSSLESSFGCWLRTGRWKTASGLSPTEVKFNPWHDVDTGQFTFSHQGRYAGLGSPPSVGHTPPYSPHGAFLRTGAHGQGGRFGGGGATGSYPTPAPTAPPPVKSKPTKASPLPKLAAAASVPTKAAPPKAMPPKPARPPAPTPAPAPASVQTHIENGIRYNVSAGRTVLVEGRLKEAKPPAPRSKKEQLRAGGPDRKPSDDGGHYIAPRFGGSKSAFNHFAQDRSVNRGQYRVLEDNWAKALRAHQEVSVTIIPHYKGPGLRPDRLSITYSINGQVTHRKISN